MPLLGAPQLYVTAGKGLQWRSRNRKLPQSLKALLPHYGTPLPRQPKIKKITHITRNMKNKIFAIPADAAAIPPNPNTAAIRAIIKKVTAQPNMFSPPLRTESH
jgi:hypothetical protein